MVMDVVVADIPPKFGMLLSRSWDAKLKGTLQMDMSYSTILFFGHIPLFLFHHPIYSVETEIGSSIFFNDSSFEEKVSETDMTSKDRSDQQIEESSEKKKQWRKSDVEHEL
jgi:hypothetical protein